MASPSSLAISWTLATISGYGIYGLQIVLECLRRGHGNVILTQKPSLTETPPLIKIALKPAFDLAEKLHAHMAQNPSETLHFKHAVLHGCSSDFTGFPWQDRIWGAPNVGCCAIEHKMLSDRGQKVAQNYDMFIAISKWNETFLKSLNLPGPVHLCYQGIDPTLFHPAPKANIYKDKFVIFSGGKFEFRKGQDLVVAAFKRFRAKHPDALLVTCWQNLANPSRLAFEIAGHIDNVPEPATDFGLAMTPWLLKQGLPADSFVDLPFTHNFMMPWVLRECDVAIFPNRCEGGTNLVAMEAMACGIPTFVSYNTGQKDLVDLIGCGAFRSQTGVAAVPSMHSLEDWGETDIDEIVAALEGVYADRKGAEKAALVTAEKLQNWAWGPLNAKLLDIVGA